MNTRIEGIGKTAWDGDIPPGAAALQKALDAAGDAYRKRFGRPPTHVALPPGADVSALKLYTLSLAHPSQPGVVIVGRAVNGHV